MHADGCTGSASSSVLNSGLPVHWLDRITSRTASAVTAFGSLISRLIRSGATGRGRVAGKKLAGLR